MAQNKKIGRYQEKRKLRLVPLEFSEPCRALVAALKAGVPGDRLADLRFAHDRYLGRELGRRQAAMLPESWSDLPPLGDQLR